MLLACSWKKSKRKREAPCVAAAGFSEKMEWAAVESREQTGPAVVEMRRRAVRGLSLVWFSRDRKC